MKQNIIQMIEKEKVIAIIRGYYGQTCLNIAKALNKGGIKLIECTFDQSSLENQEKTAECISLIKKELGDQVSVGAGTVTSVEMVQKAFEAGAEFIISPDTNSSVIKKTTELSMVSIPGALTPTEIKFAYDCGADFVKVFPASVFGPKYIKSVLAPLNQVRLLAVGGVDAENIHSYLEYGCKGAGIASGLFLKEWIEKEEWNLVEDAARKLVSSI